MQAEIKPVEAIMDPAPIVRHPQIKFWNWVADYYLCSVGEVFKAALPSGLKPESETMVEVAPDSETDEIAALDDTRLGVLTAIRNAGRVSIKDLEKSLSNPRIPALVASLVERGLVVVSEKVVERFHVVRRPYVRITLDRDNPAQAIADAFGKLRKGGKPEQALLTLIAMSDFNQRSAPLREVELNELMERAGVLRPAVKALVDKGICEIVQREISRFSYTGSGSGVLPTLSEAQDVALREIHRSFLEHNITLLHGVTSSGKTEIYIHLIDYVLRRGDQALFLVPEIALTTQLTRRLQKVFGDRVIIYHSKFSDNERVEIWKRLLNSSEPMVVIGARSAVFLPFAKLGLVIVDEEHEPSYKQYDPAPRYNARDAATVLASMHGAKTLFGSATPAIETYYKATTGKFGLVSLSKRYSDAPLPDVRLVDLNAERRNRRLNGLMSETLRLNALEALKNGRQVIFFHNRRGYSPMAKCSQCQFVIKCDNCDVSLTYHRHPEELNCHYCGARYPVPRVCPNCGEPAVEIVGFGTERIEEQIAGTFPDYRTLRMDLDTTRNKNAYSRIIDEFSEHRADILVGTQMVTKGLDFAGVSLVGVMNADALINYPDFRSAERAFNMLHQVSGRAGRRGDIPGEVLVQTFDTSHPVLAYARNNDYQGFYSHEIAERQTFGYPPFTRIINVYLKHREAAVVDAAAAQYADMLRQTLGSRVSAPIEPSVGRVSNMYIRKVALRLEPEISMPRLKDFLRQLYITIQSAPTTRSLTIYYDVDPV